MLDEQRFQYRLWRIRRSDRRFLKRHEKRVADARRRKANQRELDELEHEYHTDYVLSYDAIMKLQTQHLLRQLDKLLLPRPDFVLDTKEPQKGTWVESRVGGYHLIPNPAD